MVEVYQLHVLGLVLSLCSAGKEVAKLVDLQRSRGMLSKIICSFAGYHLGTSDDVRDVCEHWMILQACQIVKALSISVVEDTCS